MTLNLALIVLVKSNANISNVTNKLMYPKVMVLVLVILMNFKSNSTFQQW